MHTQQNQQNISTESSMARILKMGLISDFHKISDSKLKICRNDASKLAPSLPARHDPRLWRESRDGLTGVLK
jgi:hypothetical protein